MDRPTVRHRRIPATVITGFLGAGKTSLIRHLLASANGRRLALVINEFGDLGVDRALLGGCGIEGCAEGDIVELTNGCICCTVADDFLPTMEMLLDQPEPPDHIVIETSGLALPKPLVKAFSWPEVRSRVTVDGVIAVIDAAAVAAGRFAENLPAVAQEREDDPALAHDTPLVELFEDQVLCADMVLVNKADLIDEAGLGRVQDEVRPHLRPAVKIVATRYGAIDAGVLLGLAAAAEDDLDARPSHHDEEGADHEHDEFESFAVTLGPVAEPAALEQRLRSAVAAHAILRIKGFVDVAGKPMRHVVQGVGERFERYYDRPWRAGEARRTELVVIGHAGLDRGAIVAALTA